MVGLSWEASPGPRSGADGSAPGRQGLGHGVPEATCGDLVKLEGSQVQLTMLVVVGCRLLDVGSLPVAIYISGHLWPFVIVA